MRRKNKLLKATALAFIVATLGMTKVHASLDISASVDTKNNAVDLDWNEISNREEPYYFKVFQQKEKVGEYQSVSTANLSKQVKVLNVYPAVGNEISYTTWDGTKRTIDKSASVEMWMESSNPKHPKGYGMGLIDVTPVDMPTFRDNPYAYLKDEKGNWKYDVVMFGSWDASPSNDLSVKAVEAVREFHSDGRGVLFGHDQIYYGKPNFKTLSDLVLINHGVLSASDTQVKVAKTGLLTSYPWILDPNAIYTIPYTHTTGLSTGADVWFEFNEGKGGIRPPDSASQGSSPFINADGRTNNFYLATWSNAAMIQTGHSYGAATHDEQMIMANALFYLAQLTTETELKDRSGMDATAPTKPANVKATATAESLNVSLNSSTDTGNTYRYYVEGTGQDTGKTYRSNTVEVLNKSGLAGYTYEIDNKPDTVPDGTPETKTTSFKIDLKGHGGEWFHIAAVDKAGNISETVHIKFPVLFLNALVDYPNNAVDLDWNPLNGMEPYTYQVFQKKENATAFQTVSTTDVDKGEKVRVLNIFPVSAPIVRNEAKAIPLREDGSIDLAGQPVLESAALEGWIGNYGHGLIEVDNINQNDFNANPDKYLKNKNGEFVYDVAVVGFWNIREEEEHLGDKGVGALRIFAESGRGLMTGHHHMGMFQMDSGMNRLKDLFGVKFIAEIGWDHQTVNGENTENYLDYVAPQTSKSKNTSRYWHNSNQVVAAKRGLLLEYPNDVSEPGRILDIPETHNSGDFVTGDVWLSFYQPKSHGQSSLISPTILPDGTKGAKDSYLSTFNNTALIQTGHNSLATQGKMVATEDEQKVIANTIFYLAQLTTETELKDRSGMDTNGPVWNSKPDYGYSSKDGKVTFNNLSVKDIGNRYTYYVEGTGQDTQDIFKSNQVTVENKSGVAGFSYVWDNKATTVPDAMIETSSTSFNVNVPTGNAYLHIVSVDYAGNVSEVHHLDLAKPKAGQISIENITHDGYDVYVRDVRDDESGIASVQFPTWTLKNGQDDINGYPRYQPFNKVIEGTNLGNGTWRYHVDRLKHKGEFGDYMTHIYIYDHAGNVSTPTKLHHLRDQVKPHHISISGLPTTWTKSAVELIISGQDADTGIKSIILPNGEIVILNGAEKASIQYPYLIQENGTYTFTIVDDYGNRSSQSVMVSKVDLTSPIVESVSGNPTKWTNQDVTLVVRGRDSESNLKEIVNPNGTVMRGTESRYTVQKNGKYRFILRDNAGNETEKDVLVNYIDKGVPTQSSIELGNPNE